MTAGVSFNGVIIRFAKLPKLSCINRGSRTAAANFVKNKSAKADLNKISRSFFTASNFFDGGNGYLLVIEGNAFFGKDFFHYDSDQSGGAETDEVSERDVGQVVGGVYYTAERD